MSIWDHSYACVYTQGLVSPTVSQQNIFHSEKLTNFSCAPDRFRTQVTYVIESGVQRSTNWATLSPTQLLCWLYIQIDMCAINSSYNVFCADCITNEMILHLGPQARQKLLALFNQSWKTGQFLSQWKEAVVVPILKKGKEKRGKANYRPISLLSCLGKLMERLVNSRLLKTFLHTWESPLTASANWHGARRSRKLRWRQRDGFHWWRS